ncbi:MULTISPECIES: hypothetical protein [Cupriavidus]
MSAVVPNALARAQCAPGTDFEPRTCPVLLPQIRSVTIKENAQRSAAATGTDPTCKDFVVTARTVRRFLAGAKEISEQDALHTVDWSPCSAAGEVSFKDGRRGTWSVTQYRSGHLVVEGEPGMSLYCPTCDFKPFR